MILSKKPYILSKTPYILIDRAVFFDKQALHSVDRATANPTWGDIFECCFKAQSSKLESLFSLKSGKRDVRPLSFSKLSKMTPQVGLSVHSVDRAL